MPDRERIDRGLEFERRVSKLLGGKTTPGSGNQWHTLGDSLGIFCVSCKGEAIKSWNRVKEQVRESVDMAFGTGRIPALALLDDDGEEYLVIRLADVSKVLEHAGTIEVERNKGEERRALADVPAMLRSL